MMTDSKIKTTESGRPLYIEASLEQKRAYLAYWRTKNKSDYNKKRLDWANLNPEKRREQSLRSTLKTRFNISVEQYNEMVLLQNNKCKICGGHPIYTTDIRGRKKDRLDVDHCHITNKIRGLLCGNCNRGIGQFKESLDLLRKAVKYMEDCE